MTIKFLRRGDEVSFMDLASQPGPVYKGVYMEKTPVLPGSLPCLSFVVDGKAVIIFEKYAVDAESYDKYKLDYDPECLVFLQDDGFANLETMANNYTYRTGRKVRIVEE